MNLALYARVSTLDKGQDAESQLRDLRRYAQNQGWTIVKEYVDNGLSGTTKSRPQLDQMMQDVFTGAFQTVLVWRFDRIARSSRHLLAALDTFRENNIGFVSMMEGLDTSTAVGELIFTVLAALAQFERNIIIERTRAGMANARAKGIHCGRPRKSAPSPTSNVVPQ